MNKQEEEKMSGIPLRFGGMSPTVLRELSGVYQPFVKAVKEIISNSYDADASKVILEFDEEFNNLTIEDNGIGMNPMEFIHQYIRIGKSYLKKADQTPKYNRTRIGGKGIGFLAPARYCKELQITTKKNEISNNYIVVNTKGLKTPETIKLTSLFLQGHEDTTILDLIDLKMVTDLNDQPLDIEIYHNNFEVKLSHPVEGIKVWYDFDSRELELSARIDFELLFSLDSTNSLEDIENFCQINLKRTDNIKESYTKIKLIEIKDFTKAELAKIGKKGAKNIESTSGLNQFLWNLSRIVPVNAKLSDNLPDRLVKFVQDDIDSYTKTDNFKVLCQGEKITEIELTRPVLSPVNKVDSDLDQDLYKIFSFQDKGYDVRGFLIGQNTTIYPSENRGILLRVNGVAVGEPTYFGLDNLLTGSTKVALSQISGEINFIDGIDAIEDINPGRDGFYKESKLFNYMKEKLIGDNPERPNGILKDVIDAVITRSEIKASITNFEKKHENQRKAIMEIASSIANTAFEDPFIYDNFAVNKVSYELQLMPGVEYKAEGRLAKFVVEMSDEIKNNYEIDFVNKRLFLNRKSDLWKKNVNIGGQDFEIVLKRGKKSSLSCEVHPSVKKIYINWDHPMKGSMGDGEYIKHCLAVVASDIPQDRLNVYNKILGNNL